MKKFKYINTENERGGGVMLIVTYRMWCRPDSKIGVLPVHWQSNCANWFKRHLSTGTFNLLSQIHKYFMYNILSLFWFIHYSLVTFSVFILFSVLSGFNSNLILFIHNST